MVVHCSHGQAGASAAHRTMSSGDHHHHHHDDHGKSSATGGEKAPKIAAKAREAHEKAVKAMRGSKSKTADELGLSSGTKIDDDLWDGIQETLEEKMQDESEKDLPFCERTSFNIFIAVAISANALYMGLEADLGSDSNEIDVWWGFECIFTTIWSAEMILRLKTHRLRYFLVGWNILDFVLAWLSILDTWILFVIGASGGLSQFSILRILRMARMARLIRLMRAFKELWLIVQGMINALRSLSWTGLLMFLVLYCAGIFLRQIVGKYCNTDFLHFEECEEMFSSLPRTIYTLFQVLTLESWSMAIVRPIMKVHPGIVVFFICFLFLTTFGLLNIVVGVIVEHTLEAAKENEEKLQEERDRARKEELIALRHLFERADQDGTGLLNCAEFQRVCHSVEAREKFENVEMPITDASELFLILDDNNSGEITIDEFINGCLAVKKAAHASDNVMLILDVKVLKKRLEMIEACVQGIDETDHVLSLEALTQSKKDGLFQRLSRLENEVARNFKDLNQRFDHMEKLISGAHIARSTIPPKVDDTPAVNLGISDPAAHPDRMADLPPEPKSGLNGRANISHDMCTQALHHLASLGSLLEGLAEAQHPCGHSVATSIPSVPATQDHRAVPPVTHHAGWSSHNGCARHCEQPQQHQSIVSGTLGRGCKLGNTPPKKPPQVDAEDIFEVHFPNNKG